jgi:hypothetical protein
MTEQRSFVKTLSRVDLQTMCLKRLRKCSGFEVVHEVVVQPKNEPSGHPNWIVAGFKPRVENKHLRAAKETIQSLQEDYRLTDGSFVGR